jgi:hypothetical protein
MLNRRQFAQLFAVSGTAALLPSRTWAMDDFDFTSDPLPPRPLLGAPDEKFWQDVRARYLLPRDVIFVNAANLCPSPLPVVESLYQQTKTYETNPNPTVRSGLMRDGRETSARPPRHHARRHEGRNRDHQEHERGEQLRLERSPARAGRRSRRLRRQSPDEPDRVAREGEAVRVHGDHHSNGVATPGRGGIRRPLREGDHAKDAVNRFHALSSNSGDLFPAKEICAMARSRGVLTLLDGAQTFGALDVNLGEIKPDF